MTEDQGPEGIERADAPGTGAPRPAARPPVPPPEVPGRGWSPAPPPPSAPGRGLPPLFPYSPPPDLAGPAGPKPPQPEAEPPGPLRRAAPWGWGGSLAGLAVGFGPELLLYAASLGLAATDASATKVTTGSAVALVVISLVIYGWQTLAAWFFSVRVAGRRLSAWGFRRPTKAYFWTIPVGLAVVYVASILHDLVVHPKAQDIIGEFPHTPVGVALFVILAVVLAPLFEEIFFRGFLFRGFSSSWGWPAGLLISAGVFGIAHAQLDVFVPLFTLGLMLAWVYKRTGSLWTSISLHALFNAISVLAWALTAH
jgi:membrane protease YdiL (CAAX protease family)